MPAKRSLAVLLVTLLASASASAEVWRWTDDEGNVHYTDNRSAIPEKHRKKAQKTDGEELGAVGVSDGDTKDGGTRDGDTKEVEQASTTPPADTHIELAEDTAALDEGRWRASFRSARQRISELEKARAALERIVKDPAGSGMPVVRDPAGIMRPNPEYERSKARLAETEAELVRAREDLADLERRAANAAVPLEWRR